VLLADADRQRWDRALLTEGLALVASLRPVLDGGRAGPLAWQAAIAAEHAAAPTFADTDWAVIVSGYDALLTIEPSPTIALGRCVAVSYVAGASVGLADLDEVIAVGGLERYPYAHAARAQMLDRLRRLDEARASWTAAAACARTDAERRFFDERSAATGPPR
jgi:RNA polymerase sigma-70 factor (ECF subfamily)